MLQMLRWAELGMERKPLFFESIANLIWRAALSAGAAIPLATHAPEDLRSELGERARRLTYALEHVPDADPRPDDVGRANQGLLQALQNLGVDIW